MINKIEQIPGKKGYINITVVEDYEYMNPVQKLEEALFNMELGKLRTIALLKQPEELENIPQEFIDKGLANAALKSSNEYLAKFMGELKEIKLPEALVSIIGSTEKRDQVKALNKISLTTSILISFIIYAYENHGFTSSMYTSSHLHKGLNNRDMPRLAIKEDDNRISYAGNTKLSRGQIRTAIDQRTNIIARFIDNGDEWHCFYYTYRSIGGEENGGIPHIHYISHLWGLARQDVLKQFKNRHYRLPRSPHIPYERYS
jgi:hypothetical protein